MFLADSLSASRLFTLSLQRLMCVSLFYLCSVVLTFDQSASVICFSLLTACEQELYKHVSPTQEAKGSLLITGKAGRQEAHSHCYGSIQWSGSRLDVETHVPCVFELTRIPTHANKHSHTHIRTRTHTTAYPADGLASEARWITTESQSKKVKQPAFISSPTLPSFAVSRTAHTTPLHLLIGSVFTAGEFSSWTRLQCSLSSPVLAFRHVTCLSPVWPRLRAQTT